MFIAGGVASASAFRNRRRNRSMNMDIDRENIPIESSAEKTEANMEILRSMFTKYEEDVLFLLLQSNRYSLENTIENILTMDSDAPSTAQNNIDVPLPSTSTTEAPLGVFTIEDEEELVTKQDDSYFGPEPLPTNEKVIGDDRDPIPEGLQDQIGASEMSLPTNEKKPVESITDEELAFMLQNDELFQAELLSYFGEEFMRDNYMYSLPNNSNSSAINTPSASLQQREYYPQFSAPADMGMLKGITNMGVELRKRLDGFTAKYLESKSGNQSNNLWNSKLRNADDEVDEGDALDCIELQTLTSNNDKENADLRPPLPPMASQQSTNSSHSFQDGDDDDDLETINLLGSSTPNDSNQIYEKRTRSNSNTLNNMWSKFNTK